MCLLNYNRKEKKYKLSSLGKQARFRTFEDSFIWLHEAMVVNACFNATDPHVGLALSADNATQKCYMADTGLLVTHTFQDKNYTDNELYRAILFDKLNINQGMLTENIVAQMLRHRRPRLYFYPFTDPMVMPFAKFFWKNGYAIRIGRIPTNAIAIRIVVVGRSAILTPLTPLDAR